MKILIVADTYYPHVNGASYFAQRLAFYLRKDGQRVMVIAPSLDIHSQFFSHEDVNIFGVRSFPVPGIKGFRFSMPFLTRKHIRKVIEEFNPDVIHLQSHFYINKAVFNIARKMNIPIVGTNHFMPENLIHYLHLPPKVEKKVKDFAWKQFRDVYEKLDFVTAPTKTAADLVIDNGFSKEILPISNGIDLADFNPENDGEYLREKLGLPKKPILLNIGRMDKEKNVDFILRSIPAVLDKVDMHFVVAGNGKEKENLEKIAKKLGIEKNVTFAGFIINEDKKNLFDLADCYVNACEAELLCIAAMEAMASGVPIIGVRAMALPELIVDGENGYLFAPGDRKAMEEAIIKILSDKDLQKQMGEKSLEIIKNHDINVTIKKFKNLYSSAIAKHKK